MALEFNPYVVPYAIAAVVTLLLMARIWNYRDRRAAKGFLFDATGILTLCGIYVLQFLSTDVATKVFIWNWRHVAITFMAVGYLLTAIEYTNHERWLTYRNAAALAVVPVLMQVFVWWDVTRPLLYTFEYDAARNLLLPTFQPLYWVYAVTMVAYVSFGAYLLLQLTRSRRSFRKQATILVGSISLVLVGQLLYWFQVVPIDPDPLTSTVKVAAFMFGIARFELLDIVPVARNQVLENMRDAVFVVDRTNRIVAANDAGKRLVDDPDPIRKSVTEVFDNEAVTEQAHSDESQNHSEVVFTVDGEQRHFDFQTSPLYDDAGTQGGRLFVFRDITELKQREEELSILNRIVRHDINNDMTVIEGRSELLADLVDDEGMEHVTAIQNSSEHVVELTENVRTLMRSLTDDEAMELEPVDLESVLETQLRRSRDRYGDAVFVLEGEIPDDCCVRATEMLSSVFTNLLNNAVQHNDADTPRVVVSISADETTITVEVADNGPGVPADRRVEIFGRGERGLNSSGTGVGLYLVDTLVDRYGGDITVDDSDVGGASFTVTLPRVATGQSSADAATAAEQPPSAED
jgi:PAS domain S-box-containing protein